MPNYRRNRVPGGTYFFNVNLLERKLPLFFEHVDNLREAVRVVRGTRPFHIDARVVLPDHMHEFWTLPPGDDRYSDRWRAIKKAFTQSIPKTKYRTEVRIKRHERGIYPRAQVATMVLGIYDYGRKRLCPAHGLYLLPSG